MTNAEYWIWLQTALGYGSPKPIRILEVFNNAKEFYDAGPSGWQKCKAITEKDVETLKNTSFRKAQEIVLYCVEKCFKILTLDDEDYPIRLTRIKAPPAVLYIKGEFPDIDDEPAIAIIGTRKCSNAGTALAGTLGYRLSKCGMTVVSGGAKGCDIAASKGALNAKSKSIIVAGCGLSYPYLMENEEIRNAVANCGAVITELQPFDSPYKGSFPVRNRLMSALTNATLVVEAPKISGTQRTVEHALNQGKDVFVVPGSITSAEYAGNNKLLEDGATPIYTVADVVSEYISEYPHKLKLDDDAYTPLGEDKMFNRIYKTLEDRKNIKKPQITKPKTSIVKPKKEISKKPTVNTAQMSEINAQIYNFFTKGPANIDTIIDNLGLDSADVLTAITELEIDGLIKSVSGGRYELA